MKLAVEAGADDPALKRIYDGLGLKNEIVIVHGWVTSPEGPNAGRRIHHAWIEIGDGVVETQGGLKEGFPDWRYYKLFAACPNQRYSIAEAKAFMHETGWARPWRGKGDDVLPSERQEQLSKHFGQGLEWLGTRSRKKRAENTVPPTLEEITEVIAGWAPHYAAEIEQVWIYGSRAKREPKRPDSDWDVAINPVGATHDARERVAFQWLDFWANELEILCKWRVHVQLCNPPRTPNVSDGITQNGITVFNNTANVNPPV